MSAKIIDGIEFSHRPKSSGCPSGAWFTRHYHTSRAYGAWTIWETGKGEVTSRRTVAEAKAEMARLEKAIPPPPKVVPPLTPETIERYGPVDPAPARYYVSSRDGNREWLLLGPLASHEIALRMVRPVINLAHEANPMSAFYAFGTLRVKDAAADLGPGANKYFPEAFAEAAKEAA